MQYQMSGASAAPSATPQPAVPPKTASPVAQPPKSRGWIIVLLVAAAAGLAWWLWPASKQQTADSKVAATRTATVTKGVVARTLRVAGTTGAQTYVSLIAPQLHGSRGGGGRDAKDSGSTQASAPVQSNAGRSGGPSASSSASLSGATGDSSGTVQSSAGQSSSGMSSALRSATSRVGSSSGSSSSSSSSSSGASASAASSGTSGLGSTASALAGTGTSGGGGGGGDFNLVLQSVAPAGSHIKKGQVVAEFDRQLMLTRLDDYRATVVQSEDSLKKMRADQHVQRKAHDQKIDSAKAQLDKAQLDIKTTPVLGQMDAERLKLALEEAQANYKQVQSETKFFEAGLVAQLRSSELDLQQSRAELKRAESNADRMLLKAPIDGLVVMQTTFRGSEFAQIQQGDQLYPGQLFMQIVDTSSMVINAVVNQVDVEKMRIGAKASVRFDAYPDLQLTAHVYGIGAITKPGGQRANFVKEVPVMLKLDTIDPRVIPDLSVSADVVLDSEENAPAVIPAAAIFQDQPNTPAFVWVQNGVEWEKRNVELGLMNNVVVAIRSGLKPGEVVAVETPHASEPPKSGKSES